MPNSYSVFSSFPATSGTTGPTRFLEDAASGGSVRVLLSGASFTVRIQISNAGFDMSRAPAESSWEDAATVTAPDSPLTLAGPIRWCRAIVDSGQVDGGSISDTRERLAAGSSVTDWAGGDHTTLPVNSGYYRILSGTETGQVWQVAGGLTTRQTALEAVAADTLNGALRRATTAQEKLFYAPATPGQGGAAVQSWLNTRATAATQYIRGGGDLTNPLLKFILPAEFSGALIDLTAPLVIPPYMSVDFKGAQLRQLGNANALEISRSASVRNVTVWHDIGTTAGHGIVMARDSRLRNAKVFFSPENGIHGERDNGGGFGLEGAYGASLDDVEVQTAKGNGFHFAIQANAIRATRLKAFSCVGWGLYIRQASKAYFDVDLEGNTKGGIRLAGGEVVEIHGYLEANGRGDDDTTYGVWVGADETGYLPPTTVALNLYLTRGNPSFNTVGGSANLLRITKTVGLDISNVELRNSGTAPGAASLVLDGLYGATQDGQFLPSYNDEGTYTGTDVLFPNGGAPWGTPVRRKDHTVTFYPRTPVETYTEQRFVAYPGGAATGHPIIGTQHLWESAGKLAYGTSTSSPNFIPSTTAANTWTGTQTLQAANAALGLNRPSGDATLNFGISAFDNSVKQGSLFYRMGENRWVVVDTGGNIRSSLYSDGRVAPGSYTVATLPASSTSGTSILWCSDWPGGGRMVVSRGTGIWYGLAMDMYGTLTYDFPSIAAGTAATTTVSVSGAVAGYPVEVGVDTPSILSGGLVMRGWVSSADVVTIELYNRTGAAIDPASAVYTVRVKR